VSAALHAVAGVGDVKLTAIAERDSLWIVEPVSFDQPLVASNAGLWCC